MHLCLRRVFALGLLCLPLKIIYKGRVGKRAEYNGHHEHCQFYGLLFLRRLCQQCWNVRTGLHCVQCPGCEYRSGFRSWYRSLPFPFYRIFCCFFFLFLLFFAGEHRRVP